MKKMFVSITLMLLFVGISFAQSNSSLVTQSGNGNSADVNQAGGLHESIITQSTWGTGHVAEVDQSAGIHNLADILQDQRGASAYVTQIGSENTSTSKQSGPNSATVYQEGDYNILGQYSNYASRAFQKNGTSFPDDDNILELSQIGNNNKAGVWQEHHAQAFMTVEGDDNETKAYQTGTAGGSYNVATFGASGNLNIADIHQVGEGNSASIIIEGDENLGDVDQLGDNHSADVDIYNISNLNTVDIIQDGGNNSGALYRIGNGDENDLDLTQTGNGHISHVQVLSNSNKNDVDVLQYGGNDNRGLWLINGGSDENTLYVEEIGSGNRATGEIVGDYNDVNVFQQGDGNWVGENSWNAKNGVNIHGDLNSVDVQQLSNGNSSLNAISGNSNVITVNQN